MSKSGSFDLLDIFLKTELDKINATIPRERYFLQTLLEQKMTTINIATKNQLPITIPRAELEAFAEEFVPEYYAKIKVPLIFLNSGEHYRVGGDKFDEWVVEKLMGYINEKIVFLQSYVPQHHYYYAYQIQKIKKQFPNLIQTVFTI
jgi:uncharacterized protein (UPF0216 family)